MSVDEDGNLSVIDRWRRLASMSGTAKTGGHLLLLEVAPPGELEWSDFDHIAQARDHVEALLRRAFRAGTKGVNILVHGEPGTDHTPETLGVDFRAVLEHVLSRDGVEGLSRAPALNRQVRRLLGAKQVVGRPRRRPGGVGRGFGH